VRDDLELNLYFAEILKRADLRDLGDDGFFERNLLGNPHLEVRRWCALALGRIGSPRSLPWLYEALRSDYASVRAASAFAVGEVQDRESLEAQCLLPDPRAPAEVTRLLEDSSLAVRTRALEALGKIGGPSEAAEIAGQPERCSGDGFPAERVCLGYWITAMARLKDPAAIPALKKLAGSEDPEIRSRVAEAIDRLRPGFDALTLKGSPRPLCGDDAAGAAEETGQRIPAVTDAVAAALAAGRRNSTIAIIETTQGVIEIELYREDAPRTAESFVLQAEGGRLDRMETVPDGPFMVTARRPDGSAAGRSVRSEVNLRPFVRGSVGMVLSGRDSRVDSFFIALSPQPYLDGINTCFGRVISGIQAAERLTANDRIQRIRIKETISFHDYRRY
jgi:cyclophilin family peptidyl-prolyl cis-trans isomerase